MELDYKDIDERIPKVVRLNNAFDVVEVLPSYDNAGQITALLGANVAWEMIALLTWRKKHTI